MDSHVASPDRFQADQEVMHGKIPESDRGGIFQRKEDEIMSAKADKGAAVYFSWFLAYLYDPIILGLYCSFIWRCPTSTNLVPLVNRNITTKTERILDVGVGTGYYLTRMQCASKASITLLDLNENCLETASKRLKSAHPDTTCQTVRGNILDLRTLTKARFPQPFQAISLMFLLHCLPQPTSDKVAMLQRLALLVDPANGVLFGSTILGKDVTHSWLGSLVMWWHNAQGVFDNDNDGVKLIIEALQESFGQVKWEIVGVVLLFEAREPRVR